MSTPPPIDPDHQPRTPDQLHAWLIERLALVVPRKPLVRPHTAPFDYLAHAFFESPGTRDCVVWASRGGGKTFLAAVATLLDLLFKPGIEIRVLGGSLDQSRRLHHHLRNLFARPELEPLVHGRITDRRLRLANGSAAEILAQSQTSVRGTRVQKLRCDEVELFDPRVWDAAQLVTRSADCGGATVRGAVECLSTMHKPHGLMRRLVREARDGTRRIFRWGVVDVLGRCAPERECRHEQGDCPLLPECDGRAKGRDDTGDPPGHVEIDDAVTLKHRVSIDTWQSEMLCEKPSRTDAVLPEFDPQTHVVARVPPPDTVSAAVAGMDFGIRSPTVILWGLVDHAGTLWITHERAIAGVVLDTHVRALLDPARPRPAWIGVDPAGKQRSGQTGIGDADVLRQAGLDVRDLRLPLQNGLRLVRARLRPAAGPPRLFIHRDCTNLIESLERYRYPADHPFSTEPVKDGADHAADALRYLVQNLDNPHVTRHGAYLP